ncbi:MAG: 50S ribosomal protein L16 [Alphaproteobacteria bacterium]|nr:50S ribosomal protein L16 [Alphaproteobacteria bacterium]
MQLFPKKVKYRLWQKARSNPKKKRVATRRLTIAFGSCGMKSLTHGRIRTNHIESARKVLSQAVGKTGRVWIRVFPDRPWTQKAAEVPMGKGKGDLQGYECEVFPGTVLFELTGIAHTVAKKAVLSAGKKLPIKVTFMEKK